MNLAAELSRLARVLEPEVMDSSDDAADYDAMDHAEVNRRFVADYLVARGAAGLSATAEVLDLGTGTAQIPIELGRQDSQARVLAVDLAESMLVLGRANVARAGLAGPITLERVDAKRLPYDRGRFVAVMSNSIVHHIPEPGAALAEALRVLARPGLIFVRDLARPLDDDHVRRLVEQYAGDCTRHQRQLFDDSLRAALSVAEVRELVAALGGNPQCVQATSDRHWTWREVLRS
jgi:ubiquinone/menaquinone biosynthesis C-methylase UbiE